MKKIIFGVVAVAIIVVSSVGVYYGTDYFRYWTWELNITDDNGWNNVTFTQEQIDACSSDNTLDVFSSIDPYWTFLFEDETWLNYWYNQEDEWTNGGTLQHIKPDTLYYIKVTQVCTLKIEK